MGQLVVAGALAAGASAATASLLGTVTTILLTVASIAASIALQATKKQPEAVGARLDDLRVTGSAYGTAITAGFGRMRYAGNMIWSSGIQEIRHKKKVGKGGLFGGGTKVTSFWYYGNFAMLVAEGPAACITRIWADKKLIFDQTGASDAFFKYPSSSIRCYLGDETQDPDPLIQADKGTANTPAFRGIVYVVFEGLPLKDFGNRIPNLEFEVDFINPASSSRVTTTNPTNLEVSDARISSTRRQLYYTIRGTGANIAQIGRVDIDTNDLVTQVDGDDTTNHLYTNPLGGTGLNPEGVYPYTDGRVWVQGSITTGPPNNRIVEVNPYTLEFIQSGDTHVAQGPHNQGASISVTKTFALGQANMLILVYSGQTTGTDHTTFHLFDRATGFFEATLERDIGISNYLRVLGSSADRDGVAWFVGWDPSIAADGDGRQARLFRIRVDRHTSIPLFGESPTEWDLRFTEEDLTALNLHKPTVCAFDGGSNSLIILGQTGDSTGKFHFIRYDIDTRTAVEDRELDNTTDADLEPIAASHQTTQQGAIAGFLYYVGVTGKVYRLRANDLTTVEVTAGINNQKRMMHDGQSNSSFFFSDASPSNLERVLYDRCPFVPTPLETVITGLIEKTGLLTASDIDVTDPAITSQDVRGYLLEGRQSVRQFMDRLVFPFNFDVIESDVLKFVGRGGSSIRTIAQEDLGAKSGDVGEKTRLLIDRSQEQDVPEELALVYLDPARDQQQGTQTDRRHAQPNPTMFSEERLQLSIPILMTADEAAQAVEKALWNAWVARTGYEYKLPPKHLDLEPSDVVTVVRDGVSFLTRMNQVAIGGGWEMEVRATSEDSETYTSAALGSDVPVPSQVVGVPGATELFVLDVNLLRDIDDGEQDSTGVYIAGGALKAAWDSAYVERSDQGGSQFEQFALLQEPAPWGYLTVAVDPVPLDPSGDYPRQLTSFDRTTTITAHIVQGGAFLSSITEEALELDGNSFIIGEGADAEFLGTGTVTSLGNDLYTFQVLIRGRRGTENAAVAGHPVGTRIVFVLDQEDIRRKGIELNRIEQVDFYRAVTLGTLVEDAIQTSITHEANDLKPWPVAHPRASPAHTGASRAPVTITWDRRARTGNQNDLDDGVTEAPMGETIESYEVVLHAKTTGTATVGSTLDTLIDTGAAFDDGSLQVGDRVVNVTQGLETTIASIDSGTQITTDSDDAITWATSDAWEIYNEANGVLKTSVDDATGVTFSSTDITTTAGYTAGDLLDVVIYQLSAITAISDGTGRGHPRRVSI